MPASYEQTIGDRSVAAVLVEWWGKGVFFFLSLSILFLSIGRFGLPLGKAGISAWSISRTTFFFWISWKALLRLRYGRGGLALKPQLFPLPLLAFFAAVTVSLLPDFHGADDYRYFFFAVVHCVMVLDVFATSSRRTFLLLLLGVLPGFLVVRGLAHHPSLLSFSIIDFNVKNRFAYPLAHPNPAGILFSMSIPLAVAAVFGQIGWLRGAALTSLGVQFVGLILTYSRGAWLGCLSSLSAIFLMENGLRKALLTFGLMGVIAFIVITPLRVRVLTLLTPTSDIAIEGRLRFMGDALAAGMERPIWGIGYGRDRLREGVKREIPNAQKFGFIPHSHNIYTELFAETGLVGISAFLWMVLANIIALIRKARREFSLPDRIRSLCLAASLVAFLVGGLGDVPFYNHDTRIYFFTLMAMTYLALRNDIVNDWQVSPFFLKLGFRSRNLRAQTHA